MNLFHIALEKLRAENLLREIITPDGPCDKYVMVKGKSLLNLCSNNYLGLAKHSSLQESAKQAIETYGTGTGGARLLSGASPLHIALEEKVKAFRPFQLTSSSSKALLFNTGYMANLGAIQSLGSIFKAIYSDKANHASLHDGLRLLTIPFERYKHNDLNHLEKLLEKQTEPELSLVCSETLFSMDGDFADLKGLLDLQKRFGFYLYLDEAHSTGCYRNLVEPFMQSCPEKLILMGTFGKAFGSFGAYIIASPEIIDYFINFNRPFIFSTSLPPAVLAANIAAIDLVLKEPERSEKLKNLAQFALNKAKELGLQTGLSQSHILPIILGSNERAVKAAEMLRDLGYFTLPVRYPTVPKGTARLRINLSSEWEIQEIDAMLGAVKSVVEVLDQQNV